MSIFQLLLLYPIINIQAQPNNRGASLGCVCCGYDCFVNPTINGTGYLGMTATGKYIVDFNDYFYHPSNIECSDPCKTVANLCSPECFDFGSNDPSVCDPALTCYSINNVGDYPSEASYPNNASVSEVLECLMENTNVGKIIISENIALDKPVKVEYRNELEIFVEKGVIIAQDLSKKHPQLFPIEYNDDFNYFCDNCNDGAARRYWDAPLFTFTDCVDINITGYGATIQRNLKTNFSHGWAARSYEHDSGITLYGCVNVNIEGLTIKNCHGDAIQILQLKIMDYSFNGSGPFGPKNEYWDHHLYPRPYEDCNTHDSTNSYSEGTVIRCDDITIKNCNLLNNVRTGIGLEDGSNITIEGCKISNTSNFHGIATKTAIDFEPHDSGMYWENCIVRNCEIINNAGGGIIITDNYDQYTASQITIDNCYFSQNGIAHILLEPHRNDLDSEFTIKNCFFELDKAPVPVDPEENIPICYGIQYSNANDDLKTIIENCVISSGGYLFPFIFRNKKVTTELAYGTPGQFGYLEMKNITIIDQPNPPGEGRPPYKIDDQDGNCIFASLADLEFENVNLIKRAGSDPYPLVNNIPLDYDNYINQANLDCYTYDVFSYIEAYNASADPVAAGFTQTPLEYYIAENGCNIDDTNYENINDAWEAMIASNYFASANTVHDDFPFDTDLKSFDQLVDKTKVFAQFGIPSSGTPAKPTVSILPLDRCGNESGDAVSFDIFADGVDPAFTGPLSVRLKYLDPTTPPDLDPTTPDKATNGVDYDFLPQYAILQADGIGEDRRYRLRTPIIINAKADDEVEGLEEITVQIEPAWYDETESKLYYSIDPTKSSISLLISDDDMEFDNIDEFEAANNINTNEVIENGYLRLEGLLTISQDEELVLRNTSIEFFDENSGIVVEKGGKLIVEESSILRGNTCNQATWKGIQVEADYDNHLNNGVVEIRGINDYRPVIQDAIIGIHAHTEEDQIYTDDSGMDIVYNRGGQVIANNAIFSNNRTAIQFEDYSGPYYQGSLVTGGAEHEISNCSFSTIYLTPANIGISTYLFPTDEPPIYLNFNRCFFPWITITGNEFTSNSASFYDVETRGTAIKMLESTAKIGYYNPFDLYQSDEVDIDSPLRNHFNGMFKGIDSYSIFSARSPVVYNNNFENVIKGVTVNTSAAADIRHNNFMVPASEQEDAYGLWLESSNGFELYGNVYRTTANNNCGLVIKDSQLSGANESVVRTQYFDGPFESATVFLGDNTGLFWQCNTYGYYPDKEDTDLTPPPQTDWRIAEVDNLTEIEFGGNPNIQDNSLPLINNIWHDDDVNDADDKHIINESGLPVKINCDSESVPTLLLTDEANPNDEFEVNLGFTSFVNCNDFPSILPPGTDECASDLDNADTYTVRRNITNSVRDNKEDCVYDILAAQDANWSNWILVGSYVGNDDFVRADQVMQAIPIIVDRDQQLYDMYSAIINNQLYGSGKMSDAETMIRTYSKEDGIEGIAESILAYAFGENYNRNLKRRSSEEELGVLSKSINFIVYPNPAKNKAFINYIGKQEEYYAEMTVYDVNGQEQASMILKNQRDYMFDISTYRQGVYLLKIQSENTQEVLKLIVY